jgi:hypothetical protein
MIAKIVVSFAFDTEAVTPAATALPTVAPMLILTAATTPSAAASAYEYLTKMGVT